MDKQIIIGITPLYDIQRDSIWMVPGYMEGIREAGAVPIILPLTKDERELRTAFDMVDGILFTGGQDVDPAYYGEEKKSYCGELCALRDAMEKELLRLCRIKRKPVFGICRGIQFFNAMLGGTLYQDLPEELGGDTMHEMSPPYDSVMHEVTIEPGSLLYRILRRQKLGVNSYHHQGVRTPAPQLTASAWAPDGLVEAVEDRKHPFFLAVQWHPELSWRSDENSRKLFYAFVHSCRTSRKALGYGYECDIL